MRGGEGKILSPAANRRGLDTLTYVNGRRKRLARKAVGLARSTYLRLQFAQTTAGPDAEMRVWLRTYAATKQPCP